MASVSSSRNGNHKDRFPDGTMVTEIVVAVVMVGVITAIAAPRLFGAVLF